MTSAVCGPWSTAPHRFRRPCWNGPRDGPRGWARSRGPSPGYRRAAGADHDQDAGRQSGRRLACPQQWAAPVLRRLTDLGGRAGTGHETFPDAGFTQAYGMTELSPIATLL